MGGTHFKIVDKVTGKTVLDAGDRVDPKFSGPRFEVYTCTWNAVGRVCATQAQIVAAQKAKEDAAKQQRAKEAADAERRRQAQEQARRECMMEDAKGYQDRLNRLNAAGSRAADAAGRVGYAQATLRTGLEHLNGLRLANDRFHDLLGFASEAVGLIPGIGWGVALTATAVNIGSGLLRGSADPTASQLDGLFDQTQSLGRDFVADADNLAQAANHLARGSQYADAVKDATTMSRGFEVGGKVMGWGNAGLEAIEFIKGPEGMLPIDQLDRFFQIATPDQLDEFAKIMNAKSRTWNEALFGPSRAEIDKKCKELAQAKRDYEKAEEEYQKALAAFLDMSAFGACLRKKGA